MPGELVQIVHMNVAKNSICMQHFQAWNPITKIIIAYVLSDATYTSSAEFLYKVIEQMLFSFKSIQVDGVSEFMKYFEEACKKLGIELFLLQPSRTLYNDGIKTVNRTFIQEFYSRDILAKCLGEFKYHLGKDVQKYNSYRPHFSLQGLSTFPYKLKS